LISRLLYCSNFSIISKSNNSFKKYWWDSNLDSAKTECITKFKLWQEAGKPSDGPIFLEKNLARKDYKKKIFQCKENSKNVVSDKLQHHLGNANPNKFWRCWKGAFNSANNFNCDVNGLRNNYEIANCFADSFKESCTPNNILKQVELKNVYYKNKAGYSKNDDIPFVNVENVSKIIDNVGLNKAPGFDGIMIEHLKFAHPSVILIVTKLFNLCLTLGVVPEKFGVGVTTPIPKFKGIRAKVTTDDFRGITISPVISKIFEHCLLLHLKDLKTSDRQFGFKKKVGCLNSIHTIRKVINYFNNKKSTINVGMIDIRKAFDKVSHFGILCMLQKLKVNINLINVLENWFSKKFAIIKWCGVLSCKIPLEAGVRQGSILSPLLFSLYVDCVLDKLENSGLGCFNNSRCYNSYMYADDLIIITTSLTHSFTTSFIIMC